jgi:hypothetical protein
MKTIVLKKKGGLLSALVISASCLNSFASESESEKSEFVPIENVSPEVMPFLSQQKGRQGPDGEYWWTAKEIGKAEERRRRVAEETRRVKEQRMKRLLKLQRPRPEQRGRFRALAEE